MKIGDRGASVKALQAQLNSAGAFPPLAEDGIFGEKTQDAVGVMQAKMYDPPGVAGEATLHLLTWWMDRRKASPAVVITGHAALKVAIMWHARGVREIPAGSNRSPDIDALEARYGLKGQPWCAMFVGMCCLEAGLSNLPAMGLQPSVAGWVEWAKLRGLRRPADGTYVPRPGDLFCQGTSHMGFVERFDGKNIVTIEGNSSDRVASNLRRAFSATITDYICMT